MKMKKFILILSGDFQNEDTCKEIALTLTPIVDSPHLKFNFSKNTIIFHFASDVIQEELHDYILTSLFDLIDMFVLTEFDDRVDVFLPDTIKTHLFDLENESNDIEISLNNKSELTNGDDNIDESFLALLLEDIKGKVRKPSLDYILEKINDKGFDSLSQFEKDTLDYYSKN
jgi:hypothetical protein